MSDRRRRRLAVESFEERILLAATVSPINPALISTEPIDIPTPAQLGAAYRQVGAIQTRTLLALGDAYRQVQAAAAQLAGQSNHHIARDRRIVQVGAEIASLAEQGLDIARGVEDQAANKDQIYIPNHLFSSGLGTLLKAAQTLGQELTYAAGRSSHAVIHKLHTLSVQLPSAAGPRV
jgi:hypothetical protein